MVEGVLPQAALAACQHEIAGVLPGPVRQAAAACLLEFVEVVWDGRQAKNLPGALVAAWQDLEA